MDRLGVGIIGCGNISTIYMRNMPSFRGLKLVACADLRADGHRDRRVSDTRNTVLQRF